MRFGFLVLVVGCLLLASPFDANAYEEAKSLSRWVDPVILKGDSLEGLTGYRLELLRLYAAHGSDLNPIPYQFDEYTPQGHKVLPEGPEGNPQDGNGLLDAHDELIFMASDTGDRIDTDSNMMEGLQKIVEIELIDPINNQKGWCYLLAFTASPPAPSPVSYTGDVNPQNPTGYTNRQDYYHIRGKQVIHGGKTYNQIFYQEIATPKPGGGTDENYVDRMKWRVDVRFMFSLLSIKFDEDSLMGNFICWKKGPIRGTYRVYAQARLPMGLKSPRFIADVIGYRAIISTTTALSVPFNPGYVITKLVTRIGTDLGPKAYGMLFFNSENPQGFLIDGRTSEEEKQMQPAMDSWRLITGPQGTLMNRSFWSKSFMEQVPDIRITYTDDLEKPDLPEFIPGQIGNSTSVAEVKSLKAGKYLIGIEWYWPPHFYDSMSDGTLNMAVVQQYLNYQDRPLEFQVGGRKGVSLARPLPPKKGD
jgi:hypothetical protein